MIVFLTDLEVLQIHDKQIQFFGGSMGLRDQGLLNAAVEMSRQGFGGEYAHAFPWEMATSYLFHLSKNHAFVDGNKRTSLATMLVFLKVNGYTLEVDDASLEQLVLDTATGKLDKKAIAKQLEQWGKKLSS